MTTTHHPIQTDKSSFHGTSISICQHPESEIEIPQANFKSDFNDEQQLSLPDCYTNLPPTTNISTQYPIQTANLEEIQNVQDKLTQWLHQMTRLCSDEFIDTNERLLFSGFHSRTQVKQVIKGLSVLMPLLRDGINSLSMVCRCMDVIIKVINQVHPIQVPITTADQLVYALGKRIQWMYPEEHGEAKIIMSMGCLHIEMTYLSAIGDWLAGSGWDALIVEAGISTTGRAESFLSGSVVKRSRYAHSILCSITFALSGNTWK